MSKSYSKSPIKFSVSFEKNPSQKSMSLRRNKSNALSTFRNGKILESDINIIFYALCGQRNFDNSEKIRRSEKNQKHLHAKLVIQ